MKEIVFIVFDGNISFLSVIQSLHRQSTQNQMQTYFSLSVSVFYQSFKIERFLHFMYFSVCERETLLLFLMNLLTGPAFALRSLQFEISTYHSSQLTEHETCQEHYGEFHFVKQRLQKLPWFILEKLDDIGFEEAIIAQKKKFVNLV